MLVTDRGYAAACERIARCDDLVLDLETNGLVPWKGNRMVGTAVELGDGEPMYLAFRHGAGGNLADGPAKLLAALKPRAGRTFRGWHLRYDLSMLSYEDGGECFLGPDVTARDGIIAALLLNENEPSFSLEAIASKYLGPAAAESKARMEALLKERFPALRAADERKGNLWRLSGAEVEPYACGDVTMPRRLAAVYDKPIREWGLSVHEKELNAYALLLARMQKRGILIDRERCEKLSASTEARKADLLAEIRSDTGNPKFNPNSAPQVSALFGTPDAREKTLRNHPTAKAYHDLAQRIIDYKKLGKAKSAYYDAILDLMGADGVLHPQLNLTRDPRDVGGTRSGRLSCALPNFQALPHADEDPNAIYQVRDLVIPRPGRKIAKLDYQRAEMWMAASFCQEPKLIEAYHANRDIYVEMAHTLGITRHEAKILFLALQYGIGPWKIALMFGWPFETVEQLTARLGPTYLWGDEQWGVYKAQRPVQVKDGFFTLYPFIGEAMKAYAAYFEEHGCLRLWTGRVIHYDPETTPSYAAWNRVIQGAVGEMVRLAMMRLEPMLLQYDAHMILQVHDELVVEYPERAEDPVLFLCKYVMEDFDFLLKPRVDISTSAVNYAAMKKPEGERFLRLEGSHYNTTRGQRPARCVE